MKIRYIILIAAFLLIGCNAKPSANNKKTSYVDFKKFKEGRPCVEVQFKCLPESQDKSWQNKPTQDNIEDFELSPEKMKRYKYLINAWRLSKEERKKRKMLITDLDKDFHKKVEAKQFLLDMEKSLEKEFPGFWREVPKKVRYRWIRRAMAKAKKLGYGDGEITDNIQVIELCARIGLDFDLDPKWKYIVDFITIPEGINLGYAGEATNYIDFTIFNKDYDRAGNKYTDWYLRDALRYLPYPKRKVPSLHE